MAHNITRPRLILQKFVKWAAAVHDSKRSSYDYVIQLPDEIQVFPWIIDPESLRKAFAFSAHTLYPCPPILEHKSANYSFVTGGST